VLLVLVADPDGLNKEARFIVLFWEDFAGEVYSGPTEGKPVKF
jgi:hypothetical protein